MVGEMLYYSPSVQNQPNTKSLDSGFLCSVDRGFFVSLNMCLALSVHL